MNLEKFPRHKLTFGPTPIEKLERLSKHLGGKVEIFAKRDDCNSGLAFGGNKVRKMEYLVPDALAQGCDTLVTIGGIQSNHTRQVAAVAAKLGLKCRLVQENWVDYHDAVYDRVGNILMSRLMGAHVELVDAGFGINFKESWEQALEEVRREGGKPYAIPAGASDHRLGGLGYVGFAEEVRAQEAALGFKFDYIFVCSVTGSTQAGMVVGFAADGRAVARHRHRRFRQARGDLRPDFSDRRAHRRSRRARPPDHARRRRCSTRATAVRPTASPPPRRMRRSASPRGSKA